MQATIYTLKEAAELLSLHPETIRRAYRDGRIKAAVIGRMLRISETELERYWVANGGGQFWDRPKKKVQASAAKKKKGPKAREKTKSAKSAKKAPGRKAKA